MSDIAELGGFDCKGMAEGRWVRQADDKQAPVARGSRRSEAENY